MAPGLGLHQTARHLLDRLVVQATTRSTSLLERMIGLPVPVLMSGLR
jgi:hypothetical protein